MHAHILTCTQSHTRTHQPEEDDDGMLFSEMDSEQVGFKSQF